jgi:hypothetical protein
MWMGGEAAMAVESHHVQPLARPGEVVAELLEPLHHAAVYQPCAGQVDHHVVALKQAELHDLAAERKPVAELYPALRPGDIRAALGYAADMLAHETIVVQSAY